MRALHERPITTDASPAEAEVLIREARRLRRRRWSIGIAVLALAGVGIGIGIGMSSGNHAPSTGSDPSDDLPPAVTARVTTLNLSKSDKYSGIAVVGGRMMLYGPDSEFDGPPSATCSSAVVNPSSLKLVDERTESCADPSLAGQTVLPVMTAAKTLPDGGVLTYAVHISRVVAGAPGYQLGPVVMTFPEGSSSFPVWIYGGGSLWLYDPANPGGKDLLRISESTGAVTQELAVPAMARPILAFDDDGLWIAPAANSLGATSAVLHLTPGAKRAVPVFALTGGPYAAWMVASGHTVWLDVKPGSAAGTLWQLTGASAKRTSHVTLSKTVGTVLMSQGGPSGVVGDRRSLDGASFFRRGKTASGPLESDLGRRDRARDLEIWLFHTERPALQLLAGRRLRWFDVPPRSPDKCGVLPASV
jgi:hypothetical protein